MTESVEWGVETKSYKDGPHDRVISTMNYHKLTKEEAADMAAGFNNYNKDIEARLVSRIVGPWLPVEEQEYEI